MLISEKCDEKNQVWKGVRIKEEALHEGDI